MNIKKIPAAAPLAAALTLILSPTTPAYAQSINRDAVAQTATELDTVEVIGKTDYRYVQKRSTTATKTNTNLLDVPQAVTVITQDLIQDLGIQGMADAVRYVPGIGITQGEGNRDGLVFRGNSSTADLFIDGMRDDVQYYRDTYNIDRIEAFKGPNAMIFGRGSPGGLLNRVTKVADWETAREFGLQFGSWDKKRLTADVNQPINDVAAFRVTGVYEDSEGFRDGFELKREGINPTLSLRPGENTLVTLGYEYFHDERTADRGIPSRPASQTFNGTRYPVETDRETFFGDPAGSPTWVDVNAFNALVQHQFGNGALLRSRTRYADYDKLYQNVFPGNVNATGTTVALSAYNNDTQRNNLFNQTDLTFDFATGAVKHKFLVGAELGRQETDNERRSGTFTPGQSACLAGSTSSSCIVPLADPNVSLSVVYANNSANGSGDARNTGVTKVAALYAQDQIEFSPNWEAVVGVRYDRFDVDFTDLRNGVATDRRDLSSSDNLISPRVGLIYKPAENLSFYTSYGITYLPRSGEQLASLAFSTQSLDPEEFKNYEIGAKWDITPRLGATAALFRLDRSNVAVVDPADPTNIRMVLFSGDSQRTEGVELSLSGEVTEAWQIIASYTYQEAEITRDIRTSATSVTPKGTELAQTPKQMVGLWNRFDLSPNWGVGLGAIYRGESYATTSNAVTLKSYARYDGAVYYTVNDNIDLQLNVENLFNKKYFPSAHSDNNITPGAPRGYYVNARFKF
jgi:catecholate siderophore receptor